MTTRNGADLDLQTFAAGLLRLRQAAGITSFRALAAKAHFSHTALAEAAAGRVLPSLPVTLGFVSACGGDTREWEWRWRQLRETAEAPAWTPAMASSPWPSQPVEDDADPDGAGCSIDAVTVHAQRIARMEQRHILGQVELRYSPSRRAAWGRFEGYTGLDHLAGHRHDVDIIVGVVREVDDLRLSYERSYAFDYHWCGLVTTGRGRFYAMASIALDGVVAARGETKKLPLP